MTMAEETTATVAEMTFDEILEDPGHKAEFDRRVTKALATVQRKLDAEVRKNEALVKKYGTGEDGDDIETVRKQLEELRKTLGERDYADAVAREIAGADEGKGLKFTSKSAKEAFEAALGKKALPLKDGKLEGFAEFLDERRKTDPEAFATEAAEPAAKAKAKPGQKQVQFTTAIKGTEKPTREEIMAVKDRSARRALIAENRDLFE